MDMSHTSSNYAWNDTNNIRHNMKYESCSPTHTSATPTADTTQPIIALATPTHAHRHPYHHHHHHQHSACSATPTVATGDQCSRVDSPLLVGGTAATGQSAQQLNFATNHSNDGLEMDCVESGAYVTAYRTAGGLGGLSGIGRVGTGSIGIGSSSRVSRQDPLSHRIIEKRRRDRMNNCLADLSRLIPPEYLKKGRGRVEKTEIIEMAIMHMKYLQHMNHYSLGYQDCMSETLRFMVEVEGQFPRSPLCLRLLAHLQQHRDAVCVRRGSGGSTSSTSHSPVGAGGNPMSITPSCTHPSTQPSLPCSSSSPGASTPPSTAHATPTYSQPCLLKPPKLEPNNNEEDYLHHAPSQHQQRPDCSSSGGVDHFSPSCAGGLDLDDGDGCSTLDEAEEHHQDLQQETKCSLRQRVQQIQLERHPEGYKYKNDIKLRFTKDVIGGGGGGASRRDSNESTGNHSSTSPPLPHHNLSDICHQQQSANTMRSPCGSTDMTDVKETSFAVPIFALHNKGTFYVPLTVDYRALLPYLNGVELTTWPRDSVLHPVAINVNFQTLKGQG